MKQQQQQQPKYKIKTENFIYDFDNVWNGRLYAVYVCESTRAPSSVHVYNICTPHLYGFFRLRFYNQAKYLARSHLILTTNDDDDSECMLSCCELECESFYMLCSCQQTFSP